MTSTAGGNLIGSLPLQKIIKRTKKHAKRTLNNKKDKETRPPEPPRPAPYPLPPFLPGEVLEFLQLVQVVKLVVEAAHAFPGHEADVLPFLPQRACLRVLDLWLVAHNTRFAVRRNTVTLALSDMDDGPPFFHLRVLSSHGRVKFQ